MKELIFNLKTEIEKIAAPIIHLHDNATQSANGFMSKADKKKLDGIAENANNFSLNVDTELSSSSSNPVANSTLYAKYNELKDETITISNNIDSDSTDKAVSGKAVATYVASKIEEVESGTAKNPESTGAFNSFDQILDSGVYVIDGSTMTIPNGRETINVADGVLTVKKTGNIQTQNIIASNGVEYSRWRNVDGTKWNDWKVYNMPYRQYTKGLTYNTDVYNFQIMENTGGFTIIWNQGSSADKNYFITSPNAGEWKHVVLFKTALPIDGAFVFGNLEGTMDIMITGGHYDGFHNKTFASGMYIRSPQASNKIKGIHESYFVPRNN